MNPRLRFKKADGTDYPDWEEKKLTDFLEFKNGINANRDSFGTGIKLISVSDILNNDYITYDVIRNKINIDEKTKKLYEVNYGDILFQRCSETLEESGSANVYLDTQKAVFGGFVIRGKKIGEYNPIFFNHLLKSSSVRMEIKKKAQGAQHINIGQDLLSTIKFFIPCLEEQEKIANCLSSFDDLISVFTKELKNLEELKKGVMQKIFSQEVRFKKADGTDYPDWEEKKLGEVSKISTGYAFKNSDYCKDGEFLVITNANIQDNDYQVLNNVGNRINSSDKYSKYILNKNDILVTMDGTVGRVAKVYDDKMLLAQRVGRVVSSSIYNEYLFQFLSSNIFYTEMKNNAKGAMIAHISLRDIENFSVFLPCLEEQEKIADCLSAFDEAIKIKKEQIKTAKDLKKGLLQQMFT